MSEPSPAEQLGDTLSERFFAEVCDTAWSRAWSVEDLEGTPAEVLYDPEVWPVVVLDPDGNRFEVEVEVTVRPLPPIAEQLAEHERELAQFAELRRRYPDAFPTEEGAGGG